MSLNKSVSSEIFDSNSKPKELLSYTSSSSSQDLHKSTRKLVTSVYKLDNETKDYIFYSPIKLADLNSNKYFAIAILDINGESVISLQHGDVFEDVIFLFASLRKDHEPILVFLSANWMINTYKMTNEGNLFMLFSIIIYLSSNHNNYFIIFF